MDYAPQYVNYVPGKVDFNVYRGDTFVQEIEVQENDTPYDFTNCTVRMKMKWEHSEDTVEELVSPTSITLATGKMTLNLTAAETAALQPVKYRYDIQLTKPNAQVITLIRGAFQILKDVTTP
jgi:hypothetical protein